MKRILFLIALTTAGAAHAATLAPEPRELLKSIDAVLGEVPPEPATQKAWEKQKTETKAGNKVFVWGRGRTFKVRLREGMGTVFKLPDWDVIDQSVLADGVNFRQKEMNNKAMLYVEALTAGGTFLNGVREEAKTERRETASVQQPPRDKAYAAPNITSSYPVDRSFILTEDRTIPAVLLDGINTQIAGTVQNRGDKALVENDDILC